MFTDKVIHLGRAPVFFALKIFFRNRFNLDLEDEATNLMSEYFPDWENKRQSTLLWNNAYFYAELLCAVLSVKFIKATMLSHFFILHVDYNGEVSEIRSSIETSDH